MFTKILVCGFVFGCLAMLVALLERGSADANTIAQRSDRDAGGQCQGAMPVAPISTDRVFRMLAY